MMCADCSFYIKAGRETQRAVHACGWRPTDEVLAQLRQLLPAPHLSRALVQPTPTSVVECALFSPPAS